MEKSIEELAEDYCVMKQKQALGQFSDHELFIIKFAFMAGHNSHKQSVISDEDIDKMYREDCLKMNGDLMFSVGYKMAILRFVEYGY